MRFAAMSVGICDGYKGGGGAVVWCCRGVTVWWWGGVVVWWCGGAAVLLWGGVDV